MDSESLKYFKILIKRAWIIVLAAVLAGGISYFLSSQQAPSYRAQALISIGNPIELANPTEGLIDLGERLAQSYVRVINTQAVLQATIDALGLEMTTDELANNISASSVSDTPFLTISASSSDPERAAAIANEVAGYLERNSIGLTEEEQTILNSFRFQIDEINQQIEALRGQLADIDARLEVNPDSQNLIDRRTEVITAINAALSNVGQFTNVVLDLGVRASVELIDPARAPAYATGISPIVVAVAGAVIGAMFAIAVLLFFEYVNSTIRDEDEARRSLDLPILGVVKNVPSYGDNLSENLSNGTVSRSSVAEAYRAIKTNLLLSANNPHDNGIYIIASPSHKEGRTFNVGNLVKFLAETGTKVLLVDADLRHPDLHRAFGLKNDIGLSPVLAADPENADFTRLVAAQIQHTTTPNLDVMTSGLDGGEVSSQILGFENLQACIESIRDIGGYDLLFFDTAASLDVADAYILAATAKANVVLLVESGRTRAEQAVKVKDQFNHVGGHISGVILNKA